MGIIYFFGPDRTGKSTLVKNLAKDLENNGFSVKLSWMRGSHTFISLIASFLSKFENFKGSDNPYYNIKIPKKLKRFWQFMEFISALPVMVAEFLLPTLMNDYVLADRYALDLAVWLCITTHDYDFLKTFEGKILLTLAKKADSKFYVKADVDEIIRRSEKDDLWVPKEQLFLYGKLAQAIGANIIDTTNKPVEQCLQDVQNLIVLKKTIA